MGVEAVVNLKWPAELFEKTTPYKQYRIYEIWRSGLIKI